MNAQLIERLARLRGLGDAYHDFRGELKYFSLATKAGILAAMGCPIEHDEDLSKMACDIEAQRSRRFLPALLAVRGSRASLEINVSARDFGAALLWTLQLEGGARQAGTLSSADCPEAWRGEVDGTWITRRRFDLPVELPPGYHELELRLGGVGERCSLVCSPPQCFEPAGVAAGNRLWGVAVQLYTLRSHDNWGMGDFADLKALIRWLAPRGAGFIGLNPLHALAPADAARASPYSASSRHFLNTLYIAVPSVPEFDECSKARERFKDARIQQRLEALRATEHVDYQSVAQLKYEFLELLYRHFREHHLGTGSERAAAFHAFVAAGGETLQEHARFDALDRHFRHTRHCASGWQNWPEEYHDIHGRAATRFAVEEHPAQVEFFCYLQWLAHEQLAGAQLLARECGMPIGLYGDYAVGANPAGSETWASRPLYALAAEIGAPPDPLALKGQGWGIPPQDPAAMLADRLKGFIKLIRNNMRYYGALRLDHVMSLFRLWWVAQRASPTEGAYVHYPLHELLTVLSLESTRANCLVVGEDLGVVPDEMRRAMPEFGLYHYKVLLFEKQDGRFKRPEHYVRRALATATTHDMPTLRSYWEGRDIELRRQLRLYPDEAMAAEVAREREQDRGALLEVLRELNLAPENPSHTQAPFTAELAQAVHLYLARSNSALAALQIEDLIGMIDPVNVPGTHEEYPNWQRKLTVDLEEIAARADIGGQLDAVNAARQ